MTRPSNPEPSRLSDGFFRPGDHIVVVRQGSALAILDLERAVMYATTPFGAESWAALIGKGPAPPPAVAEAGTGVESADDENVEAWARIASYLLDRGIIEPVATPAAEQ